MNEPHAALPRDLVHEVSNFLTVCLTTGRLAAEGRAPLPPREALEQILTGADELCRWLEAARPSLLRQTTSGASRVPKPQAGQSIDP